MFKDAYQTVRLPDGTIFNGLFPTIEWFKIISKYVDFNQKNVLDLGCCMFGYGIEAIRAGALSVIGIDNEPKKIDDCQRLIKSWGLTNANIVSADVEAYTPNTSNIVIFSMIIHWLKSPELQIKKYIETTDTAVFIYRYPQNEPGDTGFRPTIEELDAIVGNKHFASEKISNTKEQNIMLAIYKINS